MSKIIISAFKSELSLAQNWARHEQLLTELADVSGIKSLACGRYKGTDEISIILEASWLQNCPARGQLLHKLLTQFEQESALYIQDNPTENRLPLVSLVTTDNEYVFYKFIGYWVQVSEEQAMKADGFTLVGGEYWRAV